MHASITINNVSVSFCRACDLTHATSTTTDGFCPEHASMAIEARRYEDDALGGHCCPWMAAMANFASACASCKINFG